MLELAAKEDVLPLVKEVMLNRDSVRSDAPTKYVFDERFGDLERWLLHDGWTVADGEFERLGPAAPDVLEVRDRLLEDLAESGLDADGEIGSLVEQSGRNFSADPPDFNAAATNVRIALETLIRRAAARKAQVRGEPLARDRWSDALRYLEEIGFLTDTEERSIAALYTFLSDVAHRPLNDEEWARLARTYCMATLWYVIKKWTG